MLIREHAENYIKSGLVPIPLSREGDGKGTNIEGWPGIYFEAQQFGEHNNIGLNVLLSKLKHLDWDSHNTLIFAPKFCKSTLEGGIIHPDTKKLIVTHYYYLKEGSSGDEFVKRNYPNGKTIAEFRVEGNAVVEPSIAETKLFDIKKVEHRFNLL